MLTTSSENTKSKVLGLLKSSNGLTVQELAGMMGVSVPAARKHLCDLSAMDWITSTVERRCGRGRPQHVYRLSCKGESAFPKNYANLCLDLLEHLEFLFGSGALLRMMDAREDKLYFEWQPHLAHCANLESRLDILAKLLSEAGYQARVILQGSKFYLEQGNCPNLDVAKNYKQLCFAEQRLYERLLGVPVIRESQISSGSNSCRYRIEVQNPPIA